MVMHMLVISSHFEILSYEITYVELIHDQQLHQLATIDLLSFVREKLCQVLFGVDPTVGSG